MNGTSLGAFLGQVVQADLWAATRWEEALAGCPFSTRAREVLDHHAAASRRWQERVSGWLGLPAPSGAPGLDETAAWWQEAAASHPLDQRFTWVRRNGSERESTLADVLTHLPLHGWYHRGQLRGLAQAAKWDGFPETDVPGFCQGLKLDAPAASLSEWLAVRFDHDSRAWQLWADAGLPPELQESRAQILRHHSGCPAGWGRGAAAEFQHPKPPMVKDDPLEQLKQANQWWADLVRSVDPALPYIWRRPENGDREWALAWMAVHVTGHGAYHRGQLRGLCEAAGFQDFPDTDFVLMT